MVAAPRQSRPVVRCPAPDAGATLALGAAVATLCRSGTTLFLEGELGAGKTTFARGFLTALGHPGSVKSPTYTLVESYQTRNGPVYHFDLYRLSDPEELEAMGIRDYFDGAAICLVEWPERAGALLGQPDLRVRLDLAENGRNVTLEALTDRGGAAIPLEFP
jgi:tRNA threonylcarbamoyladenosine biosynthesis protein TsaE